MIRVEDLWRTYQMGDHELHALRAINEEIADGEYVAIMGPSGSGKSTLLNLIGCLDSPTRGRYFLDGEDVAGTPVLVVDTPQGDLLVPLADEICTRVDTAARHIEVALPEGLRELNRP